MTAKIYEIDFIHYEEPDKSTVMRYHPTERIYKSFPDAIDGKILIREEDVCKWQLYGNGIKNMRYVGELHVPDNP